ncbi:MAG: type II secretion system F family protein [Candidatus Aenigmarchaeota archaeon]|nr:type II secretion system F family protein [Candidatus Aenigmarchaeota archaeon]
MKSPPPATLVPAERKRSRTFLITIIAAASLVGVGVLSGDPGVLGNLALIGVMAVVLPLFIHKYAQYARVRSMEDQFPGFVRDLGDSRRSGMSFSESIKIASRSNYGKLTEEIQLMHAKLSWGVPFARVLDLFAQRVKQSKIITEAVTIIKESYLSGGDIAATLDAIARDILMLKEAEAERGSMVKQHVMIMYGVFFMFVGISIMIILVMVPMISTQPQTLGGGGAAGGFSFSDPCEGFPFFPCNAFSLVGLFLGVPPGIANYYVALFFFVVVIQGIFTGLIAGQLGENSIVAGGKHSLIMAFAGIGIFLFISKAGFIPLG